MTAPVTGALPWAVLAAVSLGHIPPGQARLLHGQGWGQGVGGPPSPATSPLPKAHVPTWGSDLPWLSLPVVRSVGSGRFLHLLLRPPLCLPISAG